MNFQQAITLILVPLLLFSFSKCSGSKETPEPTRPAYVMTLGGPAAGEVRRFSGDDELMQN